MWTLREPYETFMRTIWVSEFLLNYPFKFLADPTPFHLMLKERGFSIWDVLIRRPSHVWVLSFKLENSLGQAGKARCCERLAGVLGLIEPTKRVMEKLNQNLQKPIKLSFCSMLFVCAYLLQCFRAPFSYLKWEKCHSLFFSAHVSCCHFSDST